MKYCRSYASFVLRPDSWLRAQVALAGILAKEWLCEGADGPNGPYLATLPWDAEGPADAEQEQEHCLWWSEAQVDALEGSGAYSAKFGLINSKLGRIFI